MKDAFGSTVESIRSGSNKKQAHGRVLDWEKKTREHGKTKAFNGTINTLSLGASLWKMAPD